MYKYDINYRALTFNNWEQCVTSELTDQLNDFIDVVNIGGVLVLIKEKSFEKAAEYIMKTIKKAVRLGLKKAVPFLTVADIIRISSRCAYLEWE